MRFFSLLGMSQATASMMFEPKAVKSPKAKMMDIPLPRPISPTSVCQDMSNIDLKDIR